MLCISRFQHLNNIKNIISEEKDMDNQMTIVLGSIQYMRG